MEESPLSQLIEKSKLLAENAEGAEHNWTESVFKLGTSENPKDQEEWKKKLDAGLQNTFEAGKAYFELMTNSTLHYEARERINRGNKERMRAFQDPRIGSIWCYVTCTRFVLGAMSFPFDYLPHLKAYIDQMHQQNVRLRDERFDSYRSLQKEATRAILVRDIFPETVGAGATAPLTDDQMTKWELQINWWENIYVSELKKHMEGFASAALEGGDLITAIDCFDYLRMLGRKEIAQRIQDQLSQLSSANQPETHAYISEVAQRLGKIQIGGNK